MVVGLKTEAVGDNWQTLEGIADVEIAGDKIPLRLRGPTRPRRSIWKSDGPNRDRES